MIALIIFVFKAIAFSTVLQVLESIQIFSPLNHSRPEQIIATEQQLIKHLNG